jgi:hypothetical protein
MELRVIFGIVGIIISVLYYIFEIYGQIEFESFAYNIGITVKKIKLKTKTEYFNKMYNKLYVKDTIHYKFVSNDTCFVRNEMKDSHFRVQVAMYTYKITIENNKYIIRIKMPVAHLLLYSIPLCQLFFIIFINNGTYSFKYFLSDPVMIVATLVCLFMSIIVKKRTKGIIINFLKIIRENK